MIAQSAEKLIFGSFNKYLILQSVNNYDWQVFRISLKGLETEEKIKKLKGWLEINEYSRRSKVQVTNYINALKRSGLIK